ncbi:MAG: hypothetical protein QM790_19095 [Nibricoccus sp.]
MYLKRLVLLLLLSARLLWAQNQDQPPPNEPIIHLPGVAVSETMKLRPQEKWLIGEIGNFDVYTNASENETREFVIKLYKFHQAFTGLFPSIKAISRDKITLVLCGSHDKYIDLAPPHTNDVDERYGHPAYTSITNAFATIFLVDFDFRSFFNDGINVGEEGATTFAQATGNEFMDNETLLRQQYMRLIISRSKPRPPAWLEEGVVRYFDSLKVSKDKISFGQLDKSLTQFFSDSGNNLHRMMSLADFFAVDYNSPEYTKSIGGRFSHQALAFVHFGLLGKKGRYRQGFLQFIDRACKEPVTEAMFKSCFNMSYEDMGYLLFAYAQGGFYRHVVAPKLKDFPPTPPLEFHLASDAEAGRIKGDILRQVGRYDDARIEYFSPIMRKHADAPLLAELGLLDYETGNLVSARKYLEQALTAKAASLPGYLALARLRLDEATGQSPDGRLSSDQLHQVLTPLFAARDLGRPHIDIYLLIAEAWSKAKVAATPEHLAVLDEGVAAFPKNTELLYKDAALKVRNGLIDDARPFIELGLRTLRVPAERERFERLKNSLPPLPTKP